MSKEIIISIIVIILIITLDVMTTNYTSDAISILSEKIEEMKGNILNSEKDEAKIKIQMKDLQTEWKKHHQKFSYYLEHDELEKVETKLARINGEIEIRKYEDTIAELDETIFILNHIKDKEKFSFQSIF